MLSSVWESLLCYCSPAETNVIISSLRDRRKSSASHTAEKKHTVWDEQDSLSWLMRWIQYGQRVGLNVFVRQACIPLFSWHSQGRPHRLPNWIKYTWCLPLHSLATPHVRGVRRRASSLKLLFSSAPWIAPGGGRRVFSATGCLLLDEEAHHHCSISNPQCACDHKLLLQFWEVRSDWANKIAGKSPHVSSQSDCRTCVNMHWQTGCGKILGHGSRYTHNTLQTTCPWFPLQFRERDWSCASRKSLLIRCGCRAKSGSLSLSEKQGASAC